MTCFQQPHSRDWKLFIAFCMIASLLFYHFHGLPSTSTNPKADLDAAYLTFGVPSSTSSQKHPIELLAEHGRRRFDRMVESQSKSLEQAIATYKKRYKMEPPPGFDDWYRLAIESNATVIDEYDSVMAMFEPYWSISAREIRARVRELLDPDFIDGKLLGIRVKDHQISTLNDKTGINPYHLNILKKRMEFFLQYLPDMEYAFNPFDQATVYAPHDVLTKAVKSCPIPEGDSNDPWEISTKSPRHIYYNFLGSERTWEIATLPCPLDSPARSDTSSQPLQMNSTDGELEQLQFPKNVSSLKNMCELPEAGDLHGLFLSPGAFWLTTTLVPIFSRTKVSTNQDLIMPSTDYEFTSVYKPYDEKEDMPWDQKKNRLYWLGDTTDGIWKNDRFWRRGQRYRLVRDLNNASKPITLYQQNSESGAWKAYRSTMRTLSKYIYVKFYKLTHCTSDELCEKIKDPKEGVAFTSKETYKDSYSSKFSFDVDGASYTERFQRLLHSHNTVFKMTIFQEWYDDFLIPWVHYVPVTVGMKELPETLRFFAETEKGQEIAKAIAEDGRNWVRQAWRPVDMKLALFRILLEYARLWGPERDRTGECPWDRKAATR